MQSISWTGLQRRLADRYDRIPALKAVVDAIVRSETDIEAVILFGSLASGECVRSSDADVIFLYALEDVDFIESSIRLRSLDPDGIMEPFTYTTGSFQRMIQDVNQVAWDAMSGGLVLYSRDETVERLETLMEEVRSAKGVAPGDNGYVIQGIRGNGA